MIFRELKRATQMLIACLDMSGERPLFIFISKPKCNQDFNETLSMSEKALKMQSILKWEFTSLVCTSYQ